MKLDASSAWKLYLSPGSQFLVMWYLHFTESITNVKYTERIPTKTLTKYLTSVCYTPGAVQTLETYQGRDDPIHNTSYHKAHLWQRDARRMPQNSYAVAANVTWAVRKFPLKEHKYQWCGIGTGCSKIKHLFSYKAELPRMATASGQFSCTNQKP